MNTDAINVKKTFFFATHSPFSNLEFAYSGRENAVKNKIGEEELYKKNIVEKLNVHHLIPVIGDNGTGKSHLIRWIHDKILIDPNINKNEFEIILIRRQNATLQNSVKQLLESSALGNSKEVKEKFETLLDVNYNNPNEIMDRLISELAHYILHDDKSPFRETEKKWLRDFFSDLYVQEKILKKKKGFIERLKSKIVNDADTRSTLNPEINSDDLYIDIQLLNKLKKEEPALSTIRIAEKIKDKADYKEKVINYINKILNKFIQRAIKLNYSDFRDIFKRIRKELRENNKNLIFLVEDITSLSGLDKELLELLIEEGNSENNELCTIFSFIGITTQYYSQLPGNIIDRISYRIHIESGSLFPSNDSILDFAFRYLNSLFLDKNKFEIWINNGAKQEEIPVVDNGVFPEWSYYNNHKSLYPLNENFILNIFNEIENKERTPRVFINEILKVYLENFKGDIKLFPPFQEAFYESGVYFKKIDDNTIDPLINKLSNNANDKRWKYFMSLYSNHNFVEKIDNEKKYFAGLSKEMIEDFGFEITFNELNPTTENEINTNNIDNKNDNIINTDQENEEILNDTQEIERELEAEYRRIESWVRNENQNQTFRRERENILNMINTISPLLDIDKNSPYYIKFIDSLKSIVTVDSELEGIITLDKNEIGEKILKAASRFEFLGNKSFDYNKSLYDINLIQNLVNDNKEEIKIYLKKERVDLLKILETLLFIGSANYDDFLNYDTAGIYRLLLSENFINKTEETSNNIRELLSKEDILNVENYIKELKSISEDQIKSVLSPYIHTIGNANPINSQNSLINFIEIRHVLENVIKDYKSSKYKTKELNIILDGLEKSRIKYNGKIKNIYNEIGSEELVKLYEEVINTLDNNQEFYNSNYKGIINNYKQKFGEDIGRIQISKENTLFDLLKFKDSGGEEYIDLYKNLQKLLNIETRQIESYINQHDGLDINRIDETITSLFKDLYSLLEGDCDDFS